MKLAILGYGTVGRGVEEIVANLSDLEVSHIFVREGKLADDPRATYSIDDILADSEVGIVAECLGGLEPARTYILAALEAGRHVVTSNKAVVAAYFDEFVAAANQSGAGFFVEACVGGGVPWIASLHRVSRIDGVTSFSGIMNGTTNYIVDAMERDGADFAEVLAQAQELGYAERDPSADIDGDDVRNKTIISTTLAFSVPCEKNLPTAGIRNLTKADLDLLASRGYSLRLLGRGVRKDGRYAAAVGPVALPTSALEAHVPSNFNLFTLEGHSIGELRFYGQGAGSLPTGNAVVQDMLDAVAGERPAYCFDTELVYDPSLLISDHLLRTSAALSGYELWAEGVYHLPQMDPVAARAALDEALAADPAAFLVALP